jgi:hypothetical protein
MSKFNRPLDNIKVASPCSSDWDAMYGDDRKRFCKQCKLSVYNLSGMTRDEAERLVMNAEGRLCVRFYRRPDGTMLTQDCPVGWAKVKQRTRIYATAVLSMLMALFTGVLVVSLFDRKGTVTIGDVIDGPTTHTPGTVAIQGNFSVPPPTKRSDSNFEVGKMRALNADEKKRIGT